MSDNLSTEIMKEVKRYDDGNGCTRRQLVDNILILISQSSRASVAAPQENDLCLLCGHKGVAPDGTCMVPVPICSDGYHGSRRCGCRCRFPPVTPSPTPEQKIDFSCRVCGVQCTVAPDPPAQAVCPEHCEDHDYEYMRGEGGHFCKHCGEQAPEDWYDD